MACLGLMMSQARPEGLNYGFRSFRVRYKNIRVGSQIVCVLHDKNDLPIRAVSAKQAGQFLCYKRRYSEANQKDSTFGLFLLSTKCWLS